MFTEDYLAAAHEALQRIEKELRDPALRRAPEIKAVESYPMKWVKLDRYLEFSGDTMGAVQWRRKAGKWLDGCQCKLVDGRLWINLREVDKWIERWHS